MPTTFLPDDVMQGLEQYMAAQFITSGVNTDAIGEAEIDDNDGLVLQMPCARPRYVETQYTSLDSTESSYDAEHIVEIWCAAEDLTSKSAQRGASRKLAGQVVTALAGQRVDVLDGSGAKTEQIRLLGIGSFPEDVLGMVYIARVAVPGIAQF